MRLKQFENIYVITSGNDQRTLISKKLIIHVK